MKLTTFFIDYAKGEKLHRIIELNSQRFELRFPERAGWRNRRYDAVLPVFPPGILKIRFSIPTATGGGAGDEG